VKERSKRGHSGGKGEKSKPGIKLRKEKVRRKTDWQERGGRGKKNPRGLSPSERAKGRGLQGRESGGVDQRERILLEGPVETRDS